MLYHSVMSVTPFCDGDDSVCDDSVISVCVFPKMFAMSFCDVCHTVP